MSPFGHSPMLGTQATPTTGPFYDLAVTHVHPHMQLMSQMTPQQQQQLQQQHQQHLQQQQQQRLQQQQQQQQHQQQQQQSHLPVSPMNMYDDWSSLAGTVVDESVFANAMAMWQQPDLGRGHPGTGG
jgi:hemolysin activation/secretion protein